MHRDFVDAGVAVGGGSPADALDGIKRVVGAGDQLIDGIAAVGDDVTDRCADQDLMIANIICLAQAPNEPNRQQLGFFLSKNPALEYDELVAADPCRNIAFVNRLCCKTDGGDSRRVSSGIDGRDAQTCRTCVSHDELA